MKKKLFIQLLCLCLFLMTACGKNNTISDNTSNVQDSSSIEETSESSDIKESKDNINDVSEKQIGFEELNEAVSIDVENTDKVEAFYKQVCGDTQNLCIRMREYSINYAEAIMASDKSNDDKYKDFEELYDCIYDDAGDDIYDEIYDGILDDIYDDFYDGILDDAYDNGAPYDEWSDFRSDVYDFWSDMRSELWDDDIERAEEKIVDFQEDVEKLKNKGTQSNTQTSNEENDSNTTPKETETNDSNTNNELVDGMRPEFKEAMDSYETFYDKYCKIIKKCTENPPDIELLADYTDMLSKAAEMTEKFDAWKNSDLNSAELKYHLDVNNRVTKKLLAASK